MEAPEIEQPKTTAAATGGRFQPGNRQGFQPGVSGNPTGFNPGKHVLALYREMATEFGGEAALSPVDRILLMQAARLLSRSRRLKDQDQAIRMSSEARRTLEGLRRRVPIKRNDGPTLGDYLAGKYGDRGAEPAGGAGRVDGGVGPPR
jgi:hypothetical protein